MPLTLSNITINTTVSIPGRTAISTSAVNNAQVSTAQYVFGNASALFSSTNSAVLATNASNVLSFGTNPFTFELRYYPISKVQSFPAIFYAPYGGGFFGGAYNLMDRHNAVPTKFTFWVGNYSTSTPLLTSTTTVSNGQWYTIAITRSANTWYMFINGTLEATASSNVNLDGNPAQISYGTSGGGTNAYINGYIDEIRISNIARYTASYTPATQPFTNDGNTKLLLHCDGANGSTSFPDDNTGSTSGAGITLSY